MSAEQAQQIMQHIQMLESHYVDLSQKRKIILNALDEATSTATAVKALSQKDESETLLPIGTGVYVPAAVRSDAPVIVNIGSNVAVQRDLGYATDYLEARIGELEFSLKNVSSQLQNVAMQIQQMREQVNQMIQSASPPPSE